MCNKLKLVEHLVRLFDVLFFFCGRILTCSPYEVKHLGNVFLEEGLYLWLLSLRGGGSPVLQLFFLGVNLLLDQDLVLFHLVPSLQLLFGSLNLQEFVLLLTLCAEDKLRALLVFGCLKAFLLN